MGLTINIKGFKGAYDCGYITFYVFRKELAKKFNPEFGELYERLLNREKFQETEINRWNEICNDDLDVFLLHSDCKGKLTHVECGKIYEVIKDMKMDIQGHNYGTMEQYNMLQRWQEMFKYCSEHRVNMLFR